MNGYTLTIDTGNGGTNGPYTFPQNMARGLYTGDFISMQIGEGEASFDQDMGPMKYALKVEKMKKSTAVPKSAWIGTTVASVDGVTYSIAPDTPCWNADNKTWFADIETALEYGAIVYFYIADGGVRVIEIHG